jgi:hypothetical protein
MSVFAEGSQDGAKAFLANELLDAACGCLRITERTRSALLEMKLKKRSHCETKRVAKWSGSSMALTVSILKDAVASLEWCELELVDKVGAKLFAVKRFAERTRNWAPKGVPLPN